MKPDSDITSLPVGSSAILENPGPVPLRVTLVGVTSGHVSVIVIPPHSSRTFGPLTEHLRCTYDELH